ncbi:zinc-ribbon domain-containing protein, partial [Flavobacteriaceae bacterium]|nr:zinc-ribbon domain-containing protein [Flavobacteriaceae bacterium]
MLKEKKSLAETHPEVAKQWHPTKNGNLTPFDVTSGSKKKIWWKCDKGNDHEWLKTIIGRSQGYNCPMCSGTKLVLSNCLETLNPELAKEWHPTKNVDLTPLDVRKNSQKKVWWKCDKGNDHEWKAIISNRKISGC